MSDYSFHTLNDREFEICAIDLISKQLNTKIERFKPGKDKGVDGRFFSSADEESIVQCKHWLRTPFKALLKHLQKVELPKVQRLQPKRYILALSHELSRQAKKQIVSIFHPFLHEVDIYGREDLNDILRTYPEVEQRHYKLWLSSTTVLQAIMNAGVRGRSEAILERIIEKANIYVHTSAQDQAIKILEQHKTAIIIGPPGAGKTTLAQHICLIYARNGYQFYHIHSIEEAEDQHTKDTRQIFYFDDFLGSNYLQAIEGRADMKIVDFISRLERDSSKRFVLTSRTNILNRGIQLSAILDSTHSSRERIEVRVDLLTQLEKARILYNHMFTRLTDIKFAEQILANKRYHSIINHRNFNPRIIDFVTDLTRLRATPEAYWDAIESTLNNPTEVWRHLYESQLDEPSRLLATLVAFNGGKIQEDDLGKSYTELLALHHVTPPTNLPLTFGATARHVTGSMITRFLDARRNVVEYDVFDPSVTDFCIQENIGNVSMRSSIFYASRTEKSLRSLDDMHRQGIISNDAFRTILQRLATKLDQDDDLDISYKIELGRLLITVPELAEPLAEKIDRIIALCIENSSDPDPMGFIKVVAWLTANGSWKSCDDTFLYYLEDICLPRVIDHENLVRVSEFLDQLDLEYRHEAQAIFERFVQDRWCDYLRDHLYDRGILDEFASNPNTDGVSEERDEKGAGNRVRREVEDILGEYGIRGGSIVTRITDSVNVPELLGEIEASFLPSTHQPLSAPSPANPNADIDDLFGGGWWIDNEE